MKSMLEFIHEINGSIVDIVHDGYYKPFKVLNIEIESKIGEPEIYTMNFIEAHDPINYAYVNPGRAHGKTSIQSEFYNYLQGKYERYITPVKSQRLVPEIKNVIYNDPATIVFWSDGTKTVVKCSENDEFDPEKGLAMAISKKALGNQGNYYNTFTKWLPEKEPILEEFTSEYASLLRSLAERLTTGG